MIGTVNNNLSFGINTNKFINTLVKAHGCTKRNGTKHIIVKRTVEGGDVACIGIPLSQKDISGDFLNRLLKQLKISVETFGKKKKTKQLR